MELSVSWSRFSKLVLRFRRKKIIEVVDMF